MRRSSFQKLDAENASVDVMLSRKITSQYDSVKVVEDRLAEIVAVAEALPQVVLAVQSAIDANESELAAQEAADLASRYATEDFNIPVIAGEYSAKHWAQVAETAAGTGVIDDLVTNTSRTWSSSKLVNSFEPIDNTIVKDADIGISVQPYNASTVVDSAYVHTDANYTTLEKTKLSGIASGAQVNTVNSVAGKTGTVTLVKGDVGLGLVDNTADISKVVASAGKLTTARSIALTGDVTGTVNFDGSANASMVTAVGNDSHLHAFANLTSKPTTVSGYGITDAYTKTEVQTVLPKIGLDTTNVTPPGVGQIAWNQNERTIDVGVNGVTLQVGQEQLINVRNNTGNLILNKTVLMATGTVGASGRITVAPYNGGDPKYILGIATEDIAAGLDGFVTSFGKVRGVNTSMWADGAVLYVALNGELTPIEPVTGVNLPVAIVVHSHATVGTLFVRITPIDVGSYEPRDVGIQAHIASLSNPHGVTKAQLLLDNVDNTADIDKAVFSATKWSTPISVNIGGTSKSVDGTASVTWSVADIGAQPVDGDLTAIGALAGTSGLLKKTAVNTWALDTTVYAIGSDMTTALANKLSQSNGVIDLGNITEVVS